MKPLNCVSFTIGFVSLLFLGQLLIADAGAPVGPDAVWNPGKNGIEMIHQQCDKASDFHACFLDSLKKSGASAAAIDFAKMTGDEMGYLREFRKVGPVDVAYVDFPFRANENEGCYLVNGNPSPIDIDNQQALPQSELDANPAYQALKKQYPNISLWPGDRFTTSYPAVSDIPVGGKSFIFPFIFRDMCHACAIIGSAGFAFDFDPSGKFQGTHLSSIQAKGNTGQMYGDPSKPIHASVGQTFSIELTSNPSTGYGWQIGKSLNAVVLQLVGNIYDEAQSTKIGAGGKEIWTFKAVGKGTATIEMTYGRPWEKNTPAAKTSSFQITVD
jgi:predicted secreted protein